MSVDFTIVIPFNESSSPSRRAGLEVVARHLAEHHGDCDVIVGASTEPWRKGVAVDDAVQATVTDGLILHDADVLVPPDALRSSMLAVVAGAPWAMPHDTVYRLSRRGTMRFLAGTLGAEPVPVPALQLERGAHVAPPGGGIVVLSRAAYDTVRGIDPRFIGWGGEDISFGRALDTLVGWGLRGDAPMWHLWHDHDPTRLRGGRGSRHNEILASQYLDACGDPELMRKVVAER